MCIGLCWFLFAGNQVHFCIKGTKSALLDQQETFTELTSHPYNAFLFPPPSNRMLHCFGSEEPPHCVPSGSVQALSLASETSRKRAVPKSPSWVTCDLGCLSKSAELCIREHDFIRMQTFCRKMKPYHLHRRKKKKQTKQITQSFLY